MTRLLTLIVFAISFFLGQQGVVEHTVKKNVLLNQMEIMQDSTIQGQKRRMCGMMKGKMHTMMGNKGMMNNEMSYKFMKMGQKNGKKMKMNKMFQDEDKR